MVTEDRREGELVKLNQRQRLHFFGLSNLVLFIEMRRLGKGWFLEGGVHVWYSGL